MQNRAVFPGSFDPITLGHVNLVERCLPLFDEIVVGIGSNQGKQYLFSLEERIRFVEGAFADFPNLRVEAYEGLTVNFCKKVGATHLLRGLRSSADFAYEKPVAQANFKLAGIDSLFVLSPPELSYVSSSIVRDIIRNGGDCSSMVPKSVTVLPGRFTN